MKKLFSAFIFFLLGITFSGFGQFTQVYNSRPGSAYVIYLDFDGHFDFSGYWSSLNYPDPIVTDASTFTGNQIKEVFNRVSEDFRIFDINISTSQAVYNAAESGKRQRIVITPESNFYTDSAGPAGGAAFVGTFGGGEIAAYVFTNQLSESPKFVAEACSHEAGHTLGLLHQSEFANTSMGCVKTAEYNDGTSETGEAGWAPIMGVGYYKNLTQWYRGPGDKATCTAAVQDDLSVITTGNGFTYIADDFGNTAATASTVAFSGNEINQTGIISNSQDIDFFSFYVPVTGTYTFSVRPNSINQTGNEGANLDTRIDVYSQSGTILAAALPITSLDASFAYTLYAGSYYKVSVQGWGLPNHTDVGGSGPSNYGSAGLYFLKIAPSFNSGTLSSANQVLCNPADPGIISFTTAAAAGSSYQWYYQNGNIAAPEISSGTAGWTLISGATANYYDPPAGLTGITSRTYVCRVTNGGISLWASGRGAISVAPAMNFGTIASGNQNFYSGSGDPALISLSTQPSGGSGNFVFQWYTAAGVQPAPTGTSIPAGWTAIAGATGNSYDPPSVTSSRSYALQVDQTGTLDCAPFTWASGVRQIAIIPFSPGTLASGNQTICYPPNPNAIAFSVAPSPGSSYQWYFQDGIIAAPAGEAALTGWTLISGATASSYDPPQGTHLSRTFACRVINGTSSLWASGVRQITVLFPFNYGTLADGNETFVGSSNPSLISYSNSPTGAAGTFTLQWYSAPGIQPAPTGSTIPAGWTAILGATTTSYDPPVLSSSASFAVLVDPTGTPDCGGPAWSTGVRQITILPFNPGTLASGDQTLCNPANPSPISFSALPNIAATFQWYYQNNFVTAPAPTDGLTGWTLISGATANTYDPPAGLTSSRTYACRVGLGSSSTLWASGVRFINVLAPVSYGVLASGNQSFTGSGDPAVISLATNPAGSFQFAYQWFSSPGIASQPSGSTIPAGWTAITGATSASYDPPSVSASTTYALRIDPVGIPDCASWGWASGVRQITISTTAFSPGTLASGNQTLCNGGDPSAISFSTAATTGSAFQWYFQNGIIAAPANTAALTGWTAITGATAASYDPPSGLTASRTYACRVTSGTNSQWASGVRQINILPAFSPGTLTTGQSGCVGYNPNPITMASNPQGSGAYNWKWFYVENTTVSCPTGSADPAGWTTSTTDTRFFGTSTTGTGIIFDPTSAGAAGRTWVLKITPAANGSTPACGTAALTNCHRTSLLACRLGEQEVQESEPEFFLGNAQPNPWEDRTEILVQLPAGKENGRIVVRSMEGKIVHLQDVSGPGQQAVLLSRRNWPAGIYFYSLEAGNEILANRKMILTGR